MQRPLAITLLGNISHVSTGATTVNLAISGVTVLAPSITVTQSLTQFLQIIGSPSPAQTYNVSGANLTGNLTITPPLFGTSYRLTGATGKQPP